jgi:protein-L-isoaspartate(D-aspartate) O-methyltransferase
MDNPSIEQYRRFFAEEICAVAQVDSPAALAAFGSVPRENFLGPAPWQIAGESFLKPSPYRATSQVKDLYHNVVVALKASSCLNNGQPSILASYIAALDVGPGSRVLHVGCGTGYYTAILAEMVGPLGSVTAIEADSDLCAQATANLSACPQVAVHCGDATGIPSEACDAILVTAGVTHPHPLWLQTLKDNGLLVLPLTVSTAPHLGNGVTVKIKRIADSFAAEVMSPIAIYSSVSVRDAHTEKLLGRSIAAREILKLQSVRVDQHPKTSDCLVHAERMCLSAAAIAVERDAGLRRLGE